MERLSFFNCARATSRALTSPRSARIAILAALVCSATLIQPSTQARADDDGQGSMLSSIMSIVGFKEKPDAVAPKIDYRQRGPLVLPKSTDLPPPVASVDQRNPAWPKDPDAEAQRRAEALARAPAQTPGRDNPMAIRDMLKDRSAAAPVSRADECDGNQCDPHIIWNQLKIKKGDPGSMSSGPRMAAGKEPPRVYLTEPPSGYLTPAANVKPTFEPQADPDAEGNSAVYYLHQKGKVAGTDTQPAN